MRFFTISSIRLMASNFCIEIRSDNREKKSPKRLLEKTSSVQPFLKSVMITIPRFSMVYDFGILNFCILCGLGRNKKTRSLWQDKSCHFGLEYPTLLPMEANQNSHDLTQTQARYHWRFRGPSLNGNYSDRRMSNC